MQFQDPTSSFTLPVSPYKEQPTCSNPPAWGVALHEEGDGRAATAAVPGPSAAARPTVHAWLGADALQTSAQRESQAGLCRGQLQPKEKENTEPA